MRPDALRAHVLGIGRLGDEHHVEGLGRAVERGKIALALLPMLKARGDEVHLETARREQRGQERVARGTLHLVSELGIATDNRDARTTGDVGLNTHTLLLSSL